jgi:hypothetical protein
MICLVPGRQFINSPARGLGASDEPSQRPIIDQGQDSTSSGPQVPPRTFGPREVTDAPTIIEGQEAPLCLTA